jgi:K+-sensing histidine kinase KdpD
VAHDLRTPLTAITVRAEPVGRRGGPLANVRRNRCGLSGFREPAGALGVNLLEISRLDWARSRGHRGVPSRVAREVALSLTDCAAARGV